MSHSITSAEIQGMSPFQRLGLYVQLRQASLNTKLASGVRSGHHMTARYVLGFVDTPDFDIMLRLQVLEGVHRGASTMGANGGTWWKQGRRGLEAAKDAFSGTGMDPSWVSTGNTGMVGKIIAMLKNAHRSWSSRYTMTVDVPDLITNMVMGLGSSGAPMAQGPVAIQVGAKNPAVKKGVPSGSETPRSVAGNLGKLYVKKMGDSLSKGDRNRAPNTTETGGSIFDRMEQGQADIFDVLADLVADPRSPIRGLIQKRFDSNLGVGKWANIASELFMAELAGTRVKKQDLAAQHGMAPGTLSKVIRTKVAPAIAAIKKDTRFKEQVMSLAERAQARRAHLRLATRVVRTCNEAGKNPSA